MAQSIYPVTSGVADYKHGYQVIGPNSNYNISPPRTPDLKPICSTISKDYAKMDWFKCLKSLNKM